MPERIQRMRTRGSKLPPNTVCVKALDAKHADSRFTKIESAQQAVDFYRMYITRYHRDFSELRGKNLACWCKVGDPCHGDIQFALANQSPQDIAHD